MLHSKQWHYSLHRDFQNCYSTRRSPTGFFSSNSTYHIHHPHTPTCAHYTIQRILHPESNSTCRRQRALRVLLLLLHTEGKETFIPEKRNSTHRRQGDLLEMHPCVLHSRPSKGIPVFPDIPVFPVFPDIPVVPDTPETFRTFQSFMTFQPFQAILQFYKVPVSPGNPTHYSILRLECIFYKFYRFYSSIGFHRKLHRVPVEQYNYKHSTNITFFKEREMLRYRSELTYSPE